MLNSSPNLVDISPITQGARNRSESKNPVLEAWVPKKPFFQTAIEDVAQLPDIYDLSPLRHGLLNAWRTKRLDFLQSRSVKPHTDSDIDADWSALWILDAGENHRIQAANYKPDLETNNPRKPRKHPIYSTLATPGMIVLLAIQHIHWLEASTDNKTLFAVTFDFQDRPTRKAVENHIVKEIQEVLNRS